MQLFSTRLHYLGDGCTVHRSLVRPPFPSWAVPRTGLIGRTLDRYRMRLPSRRKPAQEGHRSVTGRRACARSAPPSTLFHVSFQRKGPDSRNPGPSGCGMQTPDRRRLSGERNGVQSTGRARARARREVSQSAKQRTCRTAGCACALPRCPRPASLHTVSVFCPSRR